jgi:myo-inositol 2-dehydrogenase/D-chiro-inositol 1-dehydrogenase
MKKIENQSRRRFIENAALIGAMGTVGFGQLLHSCKTTIKPEDLGLKPLPDKAPDGQLLKAGVIGCGGRGTGAAFNFLNAGNDLTITAVADVFQDRIDNIRKELKEKHNIEIDDANALVGFDAFKRLLETDVDVVILATPPYFRPEHFQACVDARKQVFMEKPVAVDPAGARMIMAASKQAEAAGLVVITGTQRRFARDYRDIFLKVRNGSIGTPVAANVYWNQSKLWHRDQQPGWTEMEYMIRDWVNWIWLSGDHIVEQHIHNIDVANWFTGKVPVSATGVGSRQRRLTGDCYDNFSIDFIYEDNVHMNSMCRQINDCSNKVSEYLRGSDGYTNCANTIWNPDGSIAYEFIYPLNEEGDPDSKAMISPYDQEHVNLVTAIRNGESIVQAEETARSTLTAIMGREAAYTGRTITWEEMMSAEWKLGPGKIEMGPVDMEIVIPKPGSAPQG